MLNAMPYLWRQIILVDLLMNEFVCEQHPHKVNAVFKQAIGDDATTRNN